MTRLRRAAALLAMALAGAAVSGCLAPDVTLAAAERGRIPLEPGPVVTWDATLESFDGVAIAYTVHKPEGATPDRPVPVILSGHGWAGSRCRDACPTHVGPFLEAGFGVVTFDFRGHGESGGFAQLMDPDHDGRDVLLLVDEIATWDWVLLDGPGDPRLGAWGYSYGGAFQLVAALAETEASGRTRFDAIAPQTTWNDLSRSLAPNGVPKSVWLDLLFGLGAVRGVNVHPDVLGWYAVSKATNEMPPAALDRLSRQGAAWYAERGVRLDIPVLLQQGATDTLFPLDEALRTFDGVLSQEARAESLLVAHRNGHARSVFQDASTRLDNVCTSESWRGTDLAVLWFRRHLAGEDVDLGPQVRLATHDGCLVLDSVPVRLDERRAAPLTGAGTPVPLAAGAPVALPLAQGPLSLAGIPRLAANVTGMHPDARLFFALAVGTTPQDARVAGDQWTPMRGSAGGALPVRFDLAGVAEEVRDGETLFLLVAPFSEPYAAHGSRVPGAVVLTDVVVGLPVVDTERAEPLSWPSASRARSTLAGLG